MKNNVLFSLMCSCLFCQFQLAEIIYISMESLLSQLTETGKINNNIYIIYLLLLNKTHSTKNCIYTKYLYKNKIKISLYWWYHIEQLKVSKDSLKFGLLSILIPRSTVSEHFVKFRSNNGILFRHLHQQNSKEFP